MSGFTLIEMMIVGMILVMIFGAVVGSCVGCSAVKGPTIKRNAEVQAQEYVQRMYPGWRNPRWACQSQSTSNGHYVRCTIGGDIIEEGRTRQVTEQIECSAYWRWDTNHGCQTPRGIINMDNRGSN